MMKHRVWAEINLKAIENNCKSLMKRFGGPRKLMLVVKANAYGHGLDLILPAIKKTGVFRLGVGDSHEALALRQQGFEHQILVLGSLIDEEIISVITNDIDITVHSLDRVHFLGKIAQELGQKLKIHLKVDTGMGRFGTSSHKAKELAEAIQQSSFLQWRGLMTHFPCQNNPSELEKSLKNFEEVIRKLTPLPHGVEIHAAATAAALTEEKSHFDFVRSGLGLYGLEKMSGLEAALSLYSQIIFIKDMPSGSHIGYEKEHSCLKNTRLAIFPMGYSDGFRFCFQNRAHVLVKGRKSPVIGRISMDYSSIDISDIPEVKVGDKVTLIGQEGNKSISVADWARWSDSIPYDITCSLGNRVKRVALE
jgi:alanine racemase